MRTPARDRSPLLASLSIAVLSLSFAGVGVGPCDALPLWGSGGNVTVAPTGGIMRSASPHPSTLRAGTRPRRRYYATMVDAGSSHTAVSFWEWPECTSCGDVLRGTPEKTFLRGIGAVAQGALDAHADDRARAHALPPTRPGAVHDAAGEAAVLAAVREYALPIMEWTEQYWVRDVGTQPSTVFFFLKATAGLRVLSVALRKLILGELAALAKRSVRRTGSTYFKKKRASQKKNHKKCAWVRLRSSWFRWLPQLARPRPHVGLGTCGGGQPQPDWPPLTQFIERLLHHLALPCRRGFLVGDDFQVIDGVKEAMYAWVTVFDRMRPSGEIAVLDLGGGSTQIARSFKRAPGSPLRPRGGAAKMGGALHTNKVTVGGEVHDVACLSFLGYGLNSALQHAVEYTRLRAGRGRAGTPGGKQAAGRGPGHGHGHTHGHTHGGGDEGGDGGAAPATSVAWSGHAVQEFPADCDPSPVQEGRAGGTYERCMAVIHHVMATGPHPFDEAFPGDLPELDVPTVGISGFWHAVREMTNATNATALSLSLQQLDAQVRRWCSLPAAWNAALSRTPAHLRVCPCFKGCYVVALLRKYMLVPTQGVLFLEDVNWGHGFILQTAEHGHELRRAASKQWFWSNHVPIVSSGLHTLHHLVPGYLVAWLTATPPLALALAAVLAACCGLARGGGGGGGWGWGAGQEATAGNTPKAKAKGGGRKVKSSTGD